MEFVGAGFYRVADDVRGGVAIGRRQAAELDHVVVRGCGRRGLYVRGQSWSFRIAGFCKLHLVLHTRASALGAVASFWTVR